jgi:hypothetical protein
MTDTMTIIMPTGIAVVLRGEIRPVERVNIDELKSSVTYKVQQMQEGYSIRNVYSHIWDGAL